MTALPEGLTTGTWPIDPAHTAAYFTVRHAGISKVRGSFQDVTGTLTVGDSFEDLVFEASIKVESISTGVAQRDNHLRSSDFFLADEHPEITFRSTKVTPDSVTGDLTIRGITQEVTLDLEFEGAAKDPYGIQRAGFTGSVKINRKDFGLTYNANLETGGVLIGDTVTIAIEAEFTAPQAA